MSIFNDKSLKGVADEVTKIMEASKKEENKFHNKLDKLVHKTFGHSPDEMKKEEKELSPKQKAIAKLDHPKHKIDAGDLAKLRAGHKPVKEETEQLDELSKSTLGSYIKKASQSKSDDEYNLKRKLKVQNNFEYGKNSPAQKQIDDLKRKSDTRTQGISKAVDRLTKEETESCEDEAKEAVEKHEKKMHGKKGEVAKHEKEMHKESFTSLIESYKKEGLKSLSKMKKEEVDNETYEKEMKDQKAKFDGKKKGADVAKASVQAVKVEEEVEVIDANEINGVTIETIEEEVDLLEGILSKVAGKLANATGVTPQHVANSTISALNKKAPGTKMHNHPNFSKFKSDVHAHISSAKNAEEAIHRSSDSHVMSLAKKHFTEEVDTIEERTLTEPEMKKREEYVKGMKKKMAGFKERYGERAKSVIYATAAKMAKED
jgi:hypothetical protein